MKHCGRCGTTKPLDEFGPDRRKPDGRQPICRACANAAYRRSAAKPAVKARRSEARARWSAANPERQAVLRAGSSRRFASARAKELARQRRWYHAGGAPLALAKKRRRRAAKRGARCVPFTPEQLAARLSMFRGCWVCGGAADTVDHVKPLTAGGWHCLANLRPACRPCNARKGTRWPYVAA